MSTRSRPLKPWRRGARRPLWKRVVPLLVVLIPTVGDWVLRALAPPPALTVEVDGCDMVRAPPHDAPARTACKLSAEPGPRRLHLWIHAPAASVGVSFDGRPVEGKRLLALPGPGDEVAPVEIEVPDNARTLEVTARGESSKPAVFRLPVFTEAPSQERTQLARARVLRAKDRLEEAERTLQPLTASADPSIRAGAQRLYARVVRSRSPKEAVGQLDTAMRLDDDAGNLSDEVADGLLLALTLIDDVHDLEAAGKLFDRIAPLLGDAPRERAYASYYQSLLASARGDLAGALELLDLSAERARHLDLAWHLSVVYQQKLLLLAILGRAAEASDVRGWLSDSRMIPEWACAQAERDENLAWYALLTGTADEATGVALEEAAKLYEKGGGCNQEHELRNAYTNLARWEIDVGGYDDAERHLRAADAHGPETRPLNAVDRDLVYGKLRLRDGEP